MRENRRFRPVRRPAEQRMIDQRRQRELRRAYAYEAYRHHTFR